MHLNRTTATTIKVGIADDQEIFTNGMATFFEKIPGMELVLQAKNGSDLLTQLKAMTELPDIIIMDVEMPVMNGIEATKQVTTLYPSIKVVALSMHTDTYVMLKMLKAGCRSYLPKHVEPEKLVHAIEQVHQKGKYHDDIYVIEGKALWAILNEEQLSENEIRFIELASQELNDKQISASMQLSRHTINNYRASVFKKLKVKNAIAMVMEALRRRLIRLNNF